MEGCREDSESHFLEPETSLASTLSIEADRERTAEDRLKQRTYEDDTGSSSSDDEACRHDQRADLQKMMSRRNFAVADGNGLRHRVRSPSGPEPAPVRPEANGGSMGGGHGRRRSSIAVVPEANEMPPAEQPQLNQVVDFFRTVNKDAHLLTRMGSDGVQGCGGLVVRVFASCLRRLGLGNPGASVENMAFGTENPLDFSNKPGRSAAGDGEVARGGGGFLSGDFAVDEEELEEEDDADQEELSAQKKKVHDLGELPALDWSNASVKLLVITIVIGIIVFTRYSGYLSGERIQLGRFFSLREWLYGLCVAAGAYFVIELLAKAVAGFFKWTRLLHTNNKVWMFIKLHKDVSVLIWSLIIFFLWTWFDTTKYAPDDEGVIGKILGCFLAYTATHVVSEVCKVEMAHRYMWRPYVERARTSIWSQYVIFMMTDYAMGLQTKDVEGQALALGFTKTKKGGEHLSLYTVGKAIGFVHANALRHPLGPGRPGTDRDGMIDSKTGARLFGGLLFDALMCNFNEEAATKLLQPVVEVSDEDSTEKPAIWKPSASADAVQLPRPFARAFARAADGGGNNSGLESPSDRKLSLVLEEEQQQQQQVEKGEQKDETWTSLRADKGGVDQGEGEADDTADGNESTSTEDGDKWPAGAATAAAAAGGGGEGATNATSTATTRGPNSTCSVAKDKEVGRTAGKHRRSGGKRGSTSGGSAATNVEGAGGHKGIALTHLRQMTSKSIALKIMELFEVPLDGVVTRKEFVDRLVDIFVQRRSLQLTLADYEAILTKVGYLLTAVSLMVVAFIALRILGFNIGNLVLTWLSLGVAFSFLFGSSASAFFESIIFVFVTKAYDVGDPVFFVDDTGGEDWYVVTRINMLTTVFRRWDGQATMIANNLMAKKAIRNQWRSSPYLHHTMISVSADTPMEKLDQMKAGIAAGLRRGRHGHRHGLGGLMPDTVDYSVKGLTDGNRLSIFVCCRQRENSANMSRRFGNSSFFLKLLVRECNRHGISYTLPPQPLITGGGGDGLEAEALRTREEFLGGKLGGVDAKR
eukprot:g8124.t1